mmetsp:Transcript_44570/g.142875  ORF Transcript_44570/g.142875 Transcript_44570/m.142875 type:complete len:576 (-) Transcript_44570:87-1814(-)|eukprot:CAMPEP_0203903582 /NCGR_PEP_ID=MMETSP0359-20131031/45504_1 /ASSEMBLY_ACC=CAM_ASM_000338 /TAXON_ID=268821 /ORGANISM="Scrippsiella Hangoei, Strain SHTV-5" /LENGTH=575 /DNA_ID=CAMNT_0050827657 /DNA_START=111 /DNA_END=1838 /DNA_ORIENTATION=+
MEKQQQGRGISAAALDRPEMGQARSLEALPGLEHDMMGGTHSEGQPLRTRREHLGTKNSPPRSPRREPFGTKISPRSPRQSHNARLWGMPPASSAHPPPALLSQQQLQQCQDSWDRPSLGSQVLDTWERTSFGPASSVSVDDWLDELTGHHKPTSSQKPTKAKHSKLPLSNNRTDRLLGQGQDRVAAAGAPVVPFGGVRGRGGRSGNYYNEHYEERHALKIARSSGSSSDPLEHLSFVGLSQQNSFAFPVPAVDIDEMLDAFRGGHAAAVPLPLAKVQEQLSAIERKQTAARATEEFEEQLRAIERKKFSPLSRDELEDLPRLTVDLYGDMSPRESEERTQRNQTNFRANNEAMSFQHTAVGLTFQSNDMLDEMLGMPSLPSQYGVPNTLPGQLRNEEPHQAPVNAVRHNGLQHMQRLVATYQQQAEQLPANVEQQRAAKNIRQRLSDGGRMLLAGFSRGGACDGVSEMPGGHLQGLIPSANASASSSGRTASVGPTAGWAVSTGIASAGATPSREAERRTSKPGALSRPSGAASRLFANNRAGRKINPGSAPAPPAAQELDALLNSLMEPPALL